MPAVTTSVTAAIFLTSVSYSLSPSLVQRILRKRTHNLNIRFFDVLLTVHLSIILALSW